MAGNRHAVFGSDQGKWDRAVLQGVGLQDAEAQPLRFRATDSVHSPLIPAALMIGHHFSISAFCSARSASGVCWSRGKISWPISASRLRTLASAKASTTDPLS